MKCISKIILGIAAMALPALVAAPIAHAQCGVAQVFQSIGNAMASTCVDGSCKQVTVNTAGVDNTGKEIGRFWAAANSANANNFSGTCPSTNLASTNDSWWRVSGANRGVQGGITAGLCTASTCPDPTAQTGDQMVFLVEEWGAGGPPGINGTAYWIAFRVDATPSAPRIWDLARVSGKPPVNTTLNFLEFPTPVVTGSVHNLTGGVDTSQNYADIGLNMHSATGANNTALPDNATVKSYDICTFIGPADPGRLRSAWSCTSSVAYSNGPVSGTPFKVPCPGPGQGPECCPNCPIKTWLSIGVTFSGGAGPDVKSTLVGRAIQIECCNTLAKPESQKHPVLRPTPKKTPARSGR